MPKVTPSEVVEPRIQIQTVWLQTESLPTPPFWVSSLVWGGGAAGVVASSGGRLLEFALGLWVRETFPTTLTGPCVTPEPRTVSCPAHGRARHSGCRSASAVCGCFLRRPAAARAVRSRRCKEVCQFRGACVSTEGVPFCHHTESVCPPPHCPLISPWRSHPAPFSRSHGPSP